MKNVVIMMVLLAVSSVWAQTATEDALILNQELQFLEDSVNSVNAAPLVATPTPATTSENSTPAAQVSDTNDAASLERTYFKDSELDEIRTKASAPKRRSF